jgi:hypothetical protein
MFLGQVHFAILQRPRVWVGRRQPPTGKPADHGRRMARPWTVVPVHKLLLKTPNNPQHVTEVYVTCYRFYSSTRDFFRVAIRLYLFFDMSLSSSNTTGAKYCDCQAKVLTRGGELREAQVDFPLSVSHSCV